jgi:hypothetical protein
MTTICLYINPNAPKHLKRTMDQVFPDVPRVSAEEMLELNPGVAFTDDGPALAEYAAALVDENGDTTLFAFDDGTPHESDDGTPHGGPLDELLPEFKEEEGES